MDGVALTVNVKAARDMDSCAVRRTPADCSRYVLFGLFGVSNLGNDATLQVTLHHLRQRRPDVPVLCIGSERPDWLGNYDSQWTGLDPLPARAAWRIPSRRLRDAYIAVFTAVGEPLRWLLARRALRESDEFIVLGTGVLDDYGARPWELPTTLWRWCSAARSAGAGLRFLAVGAGPIRNPANRRLMRRAVRLAHERSYRDDVSWNFLQGIGVDTARDAIVPDLVFALPAQWSKPRRAPAVPIRTVAVGAMGYYGWGNDPAGGATVYRNYIEKLARFVAWLLDGGIDVRLILGETNSDRVAVSDLAGRATVLAGRARGRLYSEPITTFGDMLREIALSDAVVGTRFHNVICGLAMGRPVISVGYSSRFGALMSDFGLPEYSLSVDDFTTERLVSKFERLSAEAAVVARKIEMRSQAHGARLDALFDATFGARTSKPATLSPNSQLA